MRSRASSRCRISISGPSDKLSESLGAIENVLAISAFVFLARAGRIRKESIVSNDVIVGGDGYLFLKNGTNSNIDIMTGEIQVPAERIKEIANSLLEPLSKTDNQKYSIVPVLFANKEFGAKEFHPILRDFDAFSVGREVSKVDRRINYILPSLDGKSFLKKDTHWSWSGVSTSFEMIMDLLVGKSIATYEEIKGIVFPPKQFREISLDLDRKINPGSIGDFHYAGIPEYCSVYKNRIPNRGALSVSKNSKPWINKRILLIGDSFTSHMFPFFAANFESAVFFHSFSFFPDLAALVKPDVVIQAYTERFLPNLARGVFSDTPWYLYPSACGKAVDLQQMLFDSALYLAEDHNDILRMRLPASSSCIAELASNFQLDLSAYPPKKRREVRKMERSTSFSV